ncbi:hypothetical protein GCM10010446_63720 [Streptomyces enissocaesilis]|uniref:Uncharacterized protein n=1 Tax=Streptomyces enissocaesilis TaxID=332589 RepID=A0ABP6K6W1_9ACTN
MAADDEARRVRDAVRRHARTRAFAEAEQILSALLSDPGVQAARARITPTPTPPLPLASENTAVRLGKTTASEDTWVLTL